ncbi:MAG: GGDEF domain-containing protein, partial [Thermoleophilia bacterium]|nr:GGDEF domain-containing protein [Thermoleophilia bacterium]
TLWSRIRWTAHAAEDPERAVLARTLAWFLFLGATLGLLSMPLVPGAVWWPGVIGPALLAYLGAGMLIIGFDRLPGWVLHAVFAVSVVLVGVGAASASPVFAAMWFWSALTAFSFFGRREATAYTVLIAVAFAGVLVFGPPVPGAALLWLFGMATVLVGGMMMGLLRGRLEDANARLREVARTDALTGLPNRRAFEEHLAVEVPRALRGGTPLALLMVDLDHFKLVNDRHGHEAGDRALRRLANLLRSGVRAGDVPARIGGEEFCLLVAEGDEGGATALAERLRRAVADAFRPDPTPLTASFGVARCPADAVSARDLLRAADDALYAAKEAGRNRVVEAGTVLTPG